MSCFWEKRACWWRKPFFIFAWTILSHRCLGMNVLMTRVETFGFGRFVCSPITIWAAPHHIILCSKTFFPLWLTLLQTWFCVMVCVGWWQRPVTLTLMRTIKSISWVPRKEMPSTLLTWRLLIMFNNFTSLLSTMYVCSRVSTNQCINWRPVHSGNKHFYFLWVTKSMASDWMVP